MRDRQAYLAAGRNDPLSDQQRKEHPYDFVSLPPTPAVGEAVGHSTYQDQRWNGSVVLVYVTESPLHVGSGSFELASDCGFAGDGRPLRGIVRSQGLPVLPGSSFKGAIRTRFEAITRSRLGGAKDRHKERANQVPSPLRSFAGGNHKVLIQDPRVAQLRQRPVDRRSTTATVAQQLAALSPAEALFGAMNYRGRVQPGEGRITCPRAQEPLSVPPMEGPVAHRLAKPGRIRLPAAQVPNLVIDEVEGRKFHFDGPVLGSRPQTNEAGQQVGEAFELVDFVPIGSRIEIGVRLTNVTAAEIGALLMAAGYGEDVGIVRLGGFKAAGLGKVRLLTERLEIHLVPGSTRRPWREERPIPFEVSPAITQARQRLIDPAALRELHEITTRQR